MTPQDLVSQALTICGRLGAGRIAGVVESQVAFRSLNQMIDVWKSERAMVYARLRSEWPITAGKQVYTIGLTGGTADIALERPEKIEQAGFIFTNVTPQLERPFEMLTYQNWAALTPKALQSTIPYYFYYESCIPLGKINLAPKPTANWKMALYTWATINQFTGLTQAIDYLPPAHEEAIVYNLAMRLATLWPDTQPNALALNMAQESLRKIQEVNSVPLLAQVESAARGQGGRGNWSILTNDYIGRG